MVAGAFRTVAPFLDDAAIVGMKTFRGDPNSVTMLGNPVARAGKPGAKKPGQTPDLDDEIMHGLEKVEGVSNKVMMGSFAAMMGLGAGAGAATWVGNKTGVGALKSAGSLMQKANEAKFSSLGGVPILGSLGRAIGSMTQSVAVAGANVLEKLGIAQWRSQANLNGYFKKHEKLTNYADKLFAAEFTHPEVAEGMAKLKATIDVAPHAFNQEAYATAFNSVKEVAATKSPKLGSYLAKLDTHVQKAAGKYATAKGWANLSEHAGKTAENLKSTGLNHGLMNTAILTGTVVSDYRTGHDLHRALKDLRQLYADVTHQKADSVSGLKLMFGSVPKVVAQARGQLFREFGPSVVMDAANTVLNVHWVASNKGSMMLLMAAGMGSQLIRGVLAGNMLPTYTKLREAQQNGAELAAADYAALIGEASRELKIRGGAESNFAKVLGEVYASEKMKVGEVVREVDSGKMHARLEHLKAEAIKYHEAQVKSQEAKHTHDAPAENKTATHVHPEPHAHNHSAHPAHNHVDRLQNKHKAEPREILGKHTEKLHNTGQEIPSPGVAF